MFDNIGGKIKTLALVITIIWMVASCIFGFALLCSGAVLGGILAAGLGCLSAWIGSFLLYGFGELIEQQTTSNAYSAQIVNLLSRQVNNTNYGTGRATQTTATKTTVGGAGTSYQQRNTNQSQQMNRGSSFWICKSCNTQNASVNLYCKNCGQYK